MRRYLDWIRDEALPLWADAGFDAGAGRFRERLDGAGRPEAVPHRSMVQARQIYVFAHAAQLGWFDGAALAETATASLIRDFCREEGDQASFAFSIHPDGRIASDVRDAYAHAFALFALAWVYRLNGDPGLLTLADKVIRFVDAQLTDPRHGGLFDALPVATRDKRQNPHMHLLEAYLFLEQAAPGRGYLERAGALVRLFADRMLRDTVLPEYFAQDWSPLADTARSGIWEPGHHFEWVWLLDRYGRLSGETVEPWIGALDASAHAFGLTPDGLIVDEVDADGTVAKASHRIWPHTEAIKAAMARNDPAFAGRMAGVLMAHFLDRPFAGGWIDQIGPDRAPLVDYVPASSLYHLFLAAAEASPLGNRDA
ncbi:AGE family epimerase/isomerase [uncultured Sphingomonas sp.]|uniref:AGE family epimerase/isomerase n=1 Tax=uncultured Sphingomonas sp. TaxID=158754 RepID=UPI0025DD5735|nr:AGE family epimerase/isomerase [uncultured Sphingomonas sp.]